MRARAFARQCPDHPEANLVEDHAAGDLICPECGLVVGDRVVDVRSEWRSFSDSDKKSSSVDPNRVGAAGVSKGFVWQLGQRICSPAHLSLRSATVMVVCFMQQ